MGRALFSGVRATRYVGGTHCGPLVETLAFQSLRRSDTYREFREQTSQVPLLESYRWLASNRDHPTKRLSSGSLEDFPSSSL